jgi:hypothetical protein
VVDDDGGIKFESPLLGGGVLTVIPLLPLKRGGIGDVVAVAAPDDEWFDDDIAAARNPNECSDMFECC